MTKSNAVNVIKVPLPEKPAPKTTPFPRMPRMYLELLENKDKIKPSMVNQEYDPDEVSTQVSTTQSPVRNHPHSSGSVIEDDDGASYPSSGQDHESMSDASSVASSLSHEGDDISERGDEDQRSSFDEEDFQDDFQEDNDSMSLDNRSSSGSILSVQRDPHRSSNPYIPKDTTREQLHQILNPPKLSDLERAGDVQTKKVIPHLGGGGIGYESIEQEDELKRELLYKYDILRKSYRTMDIPEYTMHSDYKTMSRNYENTLRRISLDSNVENYKNYMIVAFMVIEYIFGSWFKLDMAGFTQQQILNMTQYERLLIELGEKSYSPSEKQWPVEVRLLGLILLNTVIFLIAKIMIKKTGTNLLGLLQTCTSSASVSSSNEQQQDKPKRKMKGPSIDLESIPEVGGGGSGGASVSV